MRASPPERQSCRHFRSHENAIQNTKQNFRHTCLIQMRFHLAQAPWITHNELSQNWYGLVTKWFVMFFCLSLQCCIPSTKNVSWKHFTIPSQNTPCIVTPFISCHRAFAALALIPSSTLLWRRRPNTRAFPAEMLSIDSASKQCLARSLLTKQCYGTPQLQEHSHKTSQAHPRPIFCALCVLGLAVSILAPLSRANVHPPCVSAEIISQRFIFSVILWILNGSPSTSSLFGFFFGASGRALRIVHCCVGHKALILPSQRVMLLIGRIP